MLRIGEINYLNCTPIFSMLRAHFNTPEYQFVSGTPAVLNARLRCGEIDICPSSSIEYARSPGSYLILPDLSISAYGPVKSVLLFSRLPIEKLDHASIALTDESATSVALLKIILARRYIFTNSFAVVTGGVADALLLHDAVLLIGDRALREDAEFTDCHVYDLAALWREFTGLPFVFALWLVRKEAVTRSGGEMLQLHSQLIRSKQLAMDNLASIAASLEQKSWTNSEFLINYWRTISYELSPRHIEGLRLYFQYAAECGILDVAPEIRILE